MDGRWIAYHWTMLQLGNEEIRPDCGPEPSPHTPRSLAISRSDAWAIGSGGRDKERGGGQGWELCQDVVM